MRPGGVQHDLRRRYRRWLVSVWMPAVLIVSACQLSRPGRVNLWVSDDPYPKGADTSALSVQTDGDGERQITLAGAINETLSFCLTVSAGNGSLRKLTIDPGELRCGDATISSHAFTIYRIEKVEAGPLPGWHIRSVAPSDRIRTVPDVLVPIDARTGGLPMNLRSGQAVTFWVDVNVPKGTSPGTYSGSLVVGGEKTTSSLDIRLTVWPFVLPDQPEVTVVADVDHRSLFGHHVRSAGRPVVPQRHWSQLPQANELDDVLVSTMRLLQSHQVTPVLGGLTPTVRIGADGNVEVDWAEYDRVAAGYLDGTRYFDRLPTALWPMPLTEEFPPPPPHDYTSSPAYSKMVRQYLAHCAGHFDERGWMSQSFVTLPHANLGEADPYAAARHFGVIARQAGDNLQTAAAVVPQDMADYGWHGFSRQDVSQQVDIWCPRAQFYDPLEMRQQRITGRRTFWRLDRPPFSGTTDLWGSPADVRVIAWQALGYGVETVLLGTVNAWPEARSRATEPEECVDRAGPAPLIYPGAAFGMSAPVGSVRLKRLRRSMYDAAYIQLMRSRGLGHLADTLIDSLAPRAGTDSYDAHFADGRPGGWQQDPQLWDAARQIMADEIVRATRHEQSAGAQSTADAANSVAWRRFMEQTRRLEIVTDGVRVRPAGSRRAEDTGLLEVTVWVTLINHARTPVAGEIAFESLPLAWEAVEPVVRFPEIAPQQSRQVMLQAVASGMETDVGAVRYLPLELHTSSGGRDQVRGFSVRMSHVAAAFLDSPIEVDGDLDDWPKSTGNVAADFVLITGEDPESPRLPPTRATNATQCFTATDGQALYIGFNCRLERGAELPRALRNYVRYEDGVPIGDELVELLIAPDNAGTRSPADLYHIVIKPYGWFAERGVRTDPPAGAYSPWDADIRTAVQVRRDRWVAEVRIPLDAFETVSGSPAVWGFNVTRFDRSRQEFSNWSGARHNVYDPLAAGNLALP